jgi:hypothetical protein
MSQKNSGGPCMLAFAVRLTHASLSARDDNTIAGILSMFAVHSPKTGVQQSGSFECSNMEGCFNVVSPISYASFGLMSVVDLGVWYLRSEESYHAFVFLP